MDVFAGLKYFFRPDKVCIDNMGFRICTKVTFVILIGASLVVTSRQYIGDPIDCIVNGIPDRIMDTFCWFYSTYTLKNRMNGISGRDFIQPGVAAQNELGNEIKYHRYYQWVCFALFFQAIACYLPRYMWKTFEGGRILMLSQELNSPIVEKTKKDAHKLHLIIYIKDNFNRHSFYAYRFFMCELLNFGIAVAQIYFTDYFLDGEFLYYGYEVIQANEFDDNPMARIFPKMTKCTFHKYGPSGSIQRFDGLCVLAVNNMNEKIYLFLWFWFIGMILVSCIAVIYRIIILMIPPLRLRLLQARGQMASRHDLNFIFNRCEIGDWFLLYQLSKNVDSLIFKEVCRELMSKIYNES